MESQRLIEPSELGGLWRLVAQDGQTCPIGFDTKAVGDGYALIGATSVCLDHLGLGGATYWRPSNDGIGLIDGAGAMLAFLSREAPDRFRWRGPTGNSVTLTRARPAR